MIAGAATYKRTSNLKSPDNSPSNLRPKNTIRFRERASYKVKQESVFINQIECEEKRRAIFTIQKFLHLPVSERSPPVPRDTVPYRNYADMAKAWDYGSGLGKWRKLTVARIVPQFLKIERHLCIYQNRREKVCQFSIERNTYFLYLERWR